MATLVTPIRLHYPHRIGVGWGSDPHRIGVKPPFWGRTPFRMGLLPPFTPVHFFMSDPHSPKNGGSDPHQMGVGSTRSPLYFIADPTPPFSTFCSIVFF